MEFTSNDWKSDEYIFLFCCQKSNQNSDEKKQTKQTGDPSFTVLQISMLAVKCFHHITLKLPLELQHSMKCSASTPEWSTVYLSCKYSYCEHEICHYSQEVTRVDGSPYFIWHDPRVICVSSRSQTRNCLCVGWLPKPLEIFFFLFLLFIKHGHI